jgi:hypothetical protein
MLAATMHYLYDVEAAVMKKLLSKTLSDDEKICFNWCFEAIEVLGTPVVLNLS